jgi:hypothetical protein
MTLKTLLKTSAGIIALSLAGIGGAFSGGVPSPLNTSAYATIGSPVITIKEVYSLNFGKIGPPLSGTAEVKLNATTGDRTNESADNAFLQGSSHQRGKFDFAGIPGDAFAITLSTPGTCNDTGGLLVLHNLEHNAGAPPLLLNLSGVRVGGVLSVPAATASGSWSCPYTVAADYI